MFSWRMATTWRIPESLNKLEPIDLEAQCGHVVGICAYQMLCPGGIVLVISDL